MRYYLKIFFWIWFPVTLFGLFVGTLNLMNPKGVYIPNNQPGPGHEGMMGVYSATLSAAVLGIFIGVLGVIIAFLFGAGFKKIKSARDIEQVDGE